MIVHETAFCETETANKQSNQKISINIAEIESQANLNAIEDAKAESIVWYCSGMFLPIFAMGAAYLSSPPVPAKRLIGKSPDYVIFYTEEYKRKRKQIRFGQSLVGCILGTGIAILAYTNLR